MALKEDEQPTYVHGNIRETTANTLKALEIKVPRLLSSKMLYDIDNIFISISQPNGTPVADGSFHNEGQLVISENEPLALLEDDDPRLLALVERQMLSNATDQVQTSVSRGQQNWDSARHANLIADDKVWLIVKGTSNKATTLSKASVRINGKLSKVSTTDFEALVLKTS